MKKFIAKFLSTLFFIGFIPIAPGTFGSAVAAIIYFICFPENISITGNLIILGSVLTVSLVFVPLIKLLEQEWAKDDGRIIIDEFLGYFISILFLPHTLTIIISAFFVFRLFDIIKPPPVNHLQYLPHGWGVIADDLFAGVYTNIVLQISIIICP